MGEFDGTLVAASRSADRALWVWDLATGMPVGGPLTDDARNVTSMAFGELDGTPVLLAGTSEHTVLVWSVAPQRTQEIKS